MGLAVRACKGDCDRAQVLGITNYSQWAGAAQVRGCMAASEAARGALQVFPLTASPTCRTPPFDCGMVPMQRQKTPCSVHWLARETAANGWCWGQAAALRRLEELAHVGLMERLDDSIASLAAGLGMRFHGPAWKVHALRRHACLGSSKDWCMYA
jgi:hypothetical protein